MSPEDIVNRFSYHAPNTAAKVLTHQAIRDLCRELAAELNVRLPEGREKALAITHLEEVMFWSNAAVARN